MLTVFFCELSFGIVGTCKGTPTIYFHPLVQGYRGRGLHGKYHAFHTTTEWHEGPTMHIPLLAARHSYPASWKKGWRQTKNGCYFMTVYIPCGIFITFHYNYKNMFLFPDSTCCGDVSPAPIWLEKVEARVVNFSAMDSRFWRDLFHNFRWTDCIWHLNA